MLSEVKNSTSKTQHFSSVIGFLKLNAIFSMLLVAFLFLNSQETSAQVLTEDFNYTDPTVLAGSTTVTNATTGWLSSSGVGTNNLSVTAAAGLSYASSPASGIGGGVSMTTSGEDASKAFTAITSGSVYLSFLLKVSAAQATGDYFIGVTTGTTYPVRVYAQSTTGGFKIGLSKSNGTVVYDSTVMTFGTTYLIATKYTYNASATDDIVSLWVNPTLGAAEPTALLSAGSGTADVTSIASVYLRQGAAGSAPTQIVDGIKVGTTWAQVTAASTTPTITAGGTIGAVTTTYGTASATPTSFTVSGTNMSAGILVTPPSGFEVSLSSGSGYASTVTVGSSGTISSTTVYVRLTATATPGSYSGNIALTSTSATQVNVATVSSTVSTKALTISGLTANNKTYDGTTSATFSGTPTLNGKVGSDVVTIVGSGTATFSDSAIGTAKTVTISGYSLGGTNAANYTLTTFTTTANITAAAGLSSQTITFGSLAAKNYGDASFSLTASSDSGLTVSYASSNTAVATVSGSTVTIVGAGSSIITASQSGNGSYNPATSVPQTLTVNTKTLTVSGAVAQGKVYDGTTAATITGATLNGIVGSDNVTVSGGGAFSDANIGVAKAVTAALTLGGTAAGNYSLTQPTGLTATISQASQTITFGALATKLTTDAAFALTATASSGLTVSYTSSNAAVATVSGSTVTIVGAGTTTITAIQAGDANTAAATSVPQTLTVNGVLYSNAFTQTAVCPVTFSPTVSANASGIIPTRSTLTCSPTANVFNSTTLNNTASISDTSYVEFTISGNTGYKLNITSLSFFRQGSNTCPNSLEVRYSTDGFATSTSWGAAPTTPTTGTAITWDFADFSTPYGGTVAFRFYPYGTTGANGTANAAATAGTFRIDDLTVNGSVTLIQAPAITSSLSASGTVNSPFTYSIVASNTPNNYTATGLPSGVTLNTSTGVISGTPTQAGTFNVTIGASNTGGVDTKTLVITNALGSQSITFGSLTAKNYGDASFALTGTTSSGLTVAYASSNTAVATVSGSTVTIVGAGSTTITASQAGDSNYNAASNVQQTLTVNKASQSITFGALASKLDTDANFSLTATATSGLTVTYSSSNTSVISISGSTASIVGAGTATITASQVGNSNYNSATSVNQSQVVISTALTNQTISFGSLAAKNYGDSNFNLTATSDSGLSVSYSSSDTTIATISGSTVSILKPGTVTITASQGGNGTYNPASNVQQTLVVNLKTLTVSGVTVASKTYDGTNSATITAATLNGKVGSDVVSLTNAPTFDTINAGIGISVTPNFALTGTNADRYVLTQPTGITGTILQISQTITFGALSAKTFGDAAFTLSATGGASGNTITFTSSDPTIASISGTTVTILAAGTVTITASQLGSTNYASATDVQQSLVINQKAQTIIFATLNNRYTNDAPFTLTATSTSLGTVTFVSSNTAVATISGTTVTIVGAGTANITASQAGNSNYLAAPDVVRSLKITTPPIAAWNVFGLNQTATATATTFSNLVSTGGLNTMTRGSSATASAAANSFRSTGFQNNGIATTNTDYFQVTLQPLTGTTMSLSSIDAVFNGTAGFYATPGVTSQFAYSLNGTNFNLIGSPVQSTSLTMGTIDLSGETALQNIPNGTTVTLRYYASGQTTTGGWGFYSAANSSADALAFGGVVKTVQPTTVSNQSFCQDSNPKVSNLVATGTLIKWYDAATNGNLLASNEVLTTGTYYVTQTLYGMESDRIAVNVTVSPTSVSGTASGDASICSGSSTNVSLTGSTGTVQWQSSIDGNTGWTDIAGATSATINTGGLTNTIYYRGVSTSGACSSSISNTVTVTVSQTSVSGTASGSTTICTGSSTSLTLIDNVGTIQWQKAIIGSPLVWSDILGGTSPTLSTGSVTANTYFRANVTSGVCSNSYSNIVSVIVNELSVAGNAIGNTTICSGSSTTIGLSGNTGTILWQKSANGNTNWLDINNSDSTSLNTGSLIATTYYRAMVTNLNCSADIGNTITVSVTITPAPSTFPQTLPLTSTVALLQGNGTNLKWYTSATGGTVLESSTVLTSGTYYASQTLNSCESPSRGASLVTLFGIPTVKIKANQCGSTLPSLDYNINAEYVTGYQAYRFEVTNGATVNTVEKDKYNFSLIETPGVIYATTYGIRVAVKMGGIWGAYGQTCNITTPTLTESTSGIIPTTQLIAADCGATLSSLDTPIHAKWKYGVQIYRFEVTNGTTVTIYDSPIYYFNLTKIPSSTYSTTYSIRVAINVNGVWGDYGSSCSVTTPALAVVGVQTTQLISADCGVTLSSMNSPIHAKWMYNTQAYRFELTTGATTLEYETPSYYFNLNQIAGTAYGTSYSIRVAIKVEGVWGAYGSSCPVTSPTLSTNTVPTTQIHPNYCGTTLATLDTKIPASPVYNAQGYLFEITTGGVTTVYDSTTYNFKLSQAGVVVTNGTTYAIRVAAKVNGIYGNYGSSCNVTTPTSIAKHIEETKVFTVAAYPNPFSTAFKLKVTTETEETVFVSVYDMMGKQIENKAVNTSEIENITIGQDYAAGIYTIIVSQGTNTNIVRLVKN